LLLATAAHARLKAGTATIDVTPEKFPVLVNGMFTERVATAALDKLHARALVLDDGSTRLAITFTRKAADELRARLPCSSQRAKLPASGFWSISVHMFQTRSRHDELRNGA
jgi:hypothetical protein